METMLRPMSTGELLDRTFSIYRKHFVVFAGIAAIPNLILLLFRIAFIGFGNSGNLPWNNLLSPISALVIMVIGLVAVLISQAASVIAVSDIHLGRSASISAAYAGIKGSLIELFLTIILIGAGYVVALFLLMAPIIGLPVVLEVNPNMVVALIVGAILLMAPVFVLLSIVWFLSIPAILVEVKGPLEAIKRSFALAKGSRWRIFLIMLIVIGSAYMIIVIISAPIAILVFLNIQHLQHLPAWIVILGQIANFFGSSIAVPIPVIAVSLIYYDQRVRKEGFDLQLMMTSLKSQQNAAADSTVS
jgi:hypothetical protein